eukprot:jgi/Chlat1/4499/Chrsp29S04437
MPVMIRSKRVEAPVVELAPAHERGSEQHRRRLAVFLYDTETTGLGKTDRIVEFAICTATCSDFPASVSAKSWLINPGMCIHNSRVHGITDAMVWAEVVSWVNERVDDDVLPVLVAHNSRFDERLLRQDLLQTGTPAPPQHWQFACSLFGVARKAWPLLPKHSIGFLLEALDIHVTGTLHRAAADIVALDRILLAAASHLGDWSKIEKLVRQNMKPFELEIEHPVATSVHKQVIQSHASSSRCSVAGVSHHSEAARVSSTTDVCHYVKKGSVYHLRATCKSLSRSKEVLRAAELPSTRTLCALCKAQRREDVAPTSSSNNSSSSGASSGLGPLPSPAASAEEQQQQQQQQQHPQNDGASASTPYVAVTELRADESSNNHPSALDPGSGYYYVMSGRVYHAWRTCKALSRSRDVLQLAAPPDNRTLCKVCS